MEEKPDGAKETAGYWSGTLKAAGLNYDTTRYEFLAVLSAIPLLTPHLEGGKCTFRTDHDTLKWILHIAI